MRALFTRQRVMRALLAALVALMAVVLYEADLPSLSLSVEMKSTTGAKGEIFYATTDVGYSQDRSVPFHIAADGRWHAYEIPLPLEQKIDRVRIDPGSGPGDVSVRSIELDDGSHSQEFSGQRLHGALGARNQISVHPGDQNDFSFTSEGTDPYFEIRLPQSMSGLSLSAKFRGLAALGAAVFLAWMLLEFLAGKLVKQAQRLRRTQRMAHKVCAIISDEQVLRFNGRILLAFSCIALLATLYVAMRLNQSSIGLWETMYPYQPIDQAVDIGTPKRIRADEWRVQTPWVLNQIQTGSPMQNESVGGESSPLLASLPVKGTVGLLHLKFAGFSFLDLDRGVSWWWAYKSFALLLSFLWLCLLLTRGNFAASLLGTMWIYFSSYTQWWFSSNLPEIMIAFAFGVIGAIYALFSAKRGLIAMGCALMFYSAANLALNLYPPFIVPLAYLGLAILAGYSIQNSSFNYFIHRFRFRCLAIFMAGAAIAVYAFMFVAAASTSIEAMLGTVYPGQRISASGGVPLAKLFSGFFEVFRLGETHIPFPPTNASEASGFVLLSPLMLLLVPWKGLFNRNSAILAALACFCLIATLWIVADIPAKLEWLLQMAGWSLVTPKRAVMALGVGSILACVVLFARTQEGNCLVYREDLRRMSVVTALTAVVILGWGLRQIDPEFFSWKIIFIGAVACCLVAAGMALGRTSLLAAGLAIYALPTLGINPLVSGISAITEKPILVAAATYGSNPGDKWVVIGDTSLAQGLKAHGLAVFAGTQYLPNRGNISILDPSGSYERIWNRYATIRVNSDPARKTADFKSTHGDQYSITLNVCGQQLKSLGITRIAYTVSVPDEDLACLEKLPGPEGSGVNLFKLKR